MPNSLHEREVAQMELTYHMLSRAGLRQFEQWLLAQADADLLAFDDPEHRRRDDPISELSRAVRYDPDGRVNDLATDYRDFCKHGTLTGSIPAALEQFYSSWQQDWLLNGLYVPFDVLFPAEEYGRTARPDGDGNAPEGAPEPGICTNLISALQSEPIL